MDFMWSYTLCEYFYMSVCIYVHYVCSRCLWRSDALELELSVVLSHHVGVGTCTYVLCKSSQCPESSGAIFQAPALLCLLPLIFVLVFVFPFPLLAPDLNCSIFLELSVVPSLGYSSKVLLSQCACDSRRFSLNFSFAITSWVCSGLTSFKNT